MSGIFRRKRRSFEEVMQDAPGPSPWYLRSHPPRLNCAEGPLRWREVVDEGEGSGRTILEAPDGGARLILDFYCYVLPLSARRFLVWREERRRPERPGSGSIILKVFDSDHLGEIPDIRSAGAEMKERGISIYHSAPAVAASKIPLDLGAGVHEHSLPVELGSVAELLILADSTVDGQGSIHWDRMCRSIYVVCPNGGTVEVVPQNWFNQGPYDFGYQWITRVARDTVSGRIYGEGIRLPSFILDPSGRKVVT